jgi:hypothetical protein
MCRAICGEASRSGFDERLERVPTIDALLLQVGADGGDVFVVEGYRQEKNGVRFTCQGSRQGLRRRGWVDVQGELRQSVAFPLEGTEAVNRPASGRPKPACPERPSKGTEVVKLA